MRQIWHLFSQTLNNFIFGQSDKTDWNSLPRWNNNSNEIISIFQYHHPAVRELIWKFKYRGDKLITQKFATYLFDLIMEEESDRQEFGAKPSILISIPARPERLKQIGFDQCDRLVKNIFLRSPKSFVLGKNILLKISHTKSQAHTSNAKERQNNVLGSFAVNPKTITQIKDRNIILIDDVWTTGATIDEAKKALSQAQPKQIKVYTLAH